MLPWRRRATTSSPPIARLRPQRRHQRHVRSGLGPFSTLNRVRDMMAFITRWDIARSRWWSAMISDRRWPVVRADAAGLCFLLGGDDECAVRRSGTAPFIRRMKSSKAATTPAPSLDDERRSCRSRAAYQTYYTTREANENMWPRRKHPNFPARLLPRKAPTGPPTSRSRSHRTQATEMAKLPKYYVMDLDKGMAEQVAIDMRRRRDRQLQVAHGRN